MPQDLEAILEYERRKHEKRDNLVQSFSFSLGSVLFILTLAILLAIVYWLLSPRAKAIEAERYIVELDEFKAALDIAANPQIFDMRTEDEYVDGHLPGAQLTVTDRCHEFGVDICSRGRQCEEFGTAFFYSVKGENYHEVNYAVRISKTNCWSKVYMLDGGFNAWQEAGYDVEYK